MTSKKNEVGKQGEQLAAVFLKKNGYKVLEYNYRNRLGEIDIIAKDGDFICFIEVKTRLSNHQGTPLEAITTQKQKKISQVALSYLKQKHLIDQYARFDVVSVEKTPDGKEKIDVLKDAFALSEPYSY